MCMCVCMWLMIACTPYQSSEHTGPETAAHAVQQLRQATRRHTSAVPRQQVHVSRYTSAGARQQAHVSRCTSAGTRQQAHVGTYTLACSSFYDPPLTYVGAATAPLIPSILFYSRQKRPIPNTHKHAHRITHTCAHTHRHTGTHTHKHTHTHTCSSPLPFGWGTKYFTPLNDSVMGSKCRAVATTTLASVDAVSMCVCVGGGGGCLGGGADPP
jgi:hypothetical protein